LQEQAQQAHFMGTLHAQAQQAHGHTSCAQAHPVLSSLPPSARFDMRKRLLLTTFVEGTLMPAPTRKP